MLNEKQKSSLLYKHYLGVGSTRTQREFFEEAVKSAFVVKPEQLWAYGEELPDGTERTGGETAIQKVKALSETGDTYTWAKNEAESEYPLVKYWKRWQLTKVDNGTDNAFLLLDSEGKQIKNIIPFNFYEDVYCYTLYTSAGQQIPFGVGDWLLDVYSGILTFYGDVPDGVDHDNPPLLTFYQYVGGNGFRQDEKNFEVAVLPINNFYIGKGTTCFDTNTDNGKTIVEYMIEQTSKIHEGFIQTYGFDGNDSNEGIALDWERVMPLTYTQSRDPVKGYDDSTASQIGLILSSKATEADFSESPFKVVFVSQSTRCDAFTVNLSNGDIEAYVNGVKTDSASYKILEDKSVIKLSLGEGFIYIQKKDDQESFTQTVEVLRFDNHKDIETAKVKAFLVYWSSVSKEWLPFITKEDNYYDFGFPVVTLQGKIPPSLMLDTAALSTFDDIITPEYYGPRTANIVIATETGDQVKSADYIVKNRSGWYLDEVITKAKEEHPLGKYLLRTGRYEVASSWTANDLIIEGETSNTTIAVDGDIALNNVSFASVTIEARHINVSGIASFSDVKASDTDLTFENGNIFIRGSSFKDAEVKSSEGSFLSRIESSSFRNVKLDAEDIVFSSNYVNELSLPKGRSVIRSCYINKVQTIYRDSHLLGSYVADYNAAGAEHPDLMPVGSDREDTSGRIMVFDKEDWKHLRYAEFAAPLGYSKDESIIKLLYDPNYIGLNDKGEVIITMTSEFMKLGAVTFKRGLNATDDGTSYLEDKQYDENTTIKDALQDLWKEKADLNSNGKVPLQQLPDAVAYGGLLYVGDWSFQKSNGEYPTFRDSNPFLSSDHESDGLQPGWFFIVSASKDTPSTSSDSSGDGSDGENDDPVKIQHSKDGVEYTAGDWLMYGGNKGWNKAALKQNLDGLKIYFSYEDKDYYVKFYRDNALNQYQMQYGPADDDTYESRYGYGRNAAVYKDTTVLIDTVVKISEDETVLTFPQKIEILSVKAGVVKIKFGSTVIAGFTTGLESYDIWSKIDRAYSDPTYSPLPAVSRPTNEPNRPWFWKDDRNGGALDLSSNTIITAFDKINKQLRKLEPKKPLNINTARLVADLDGLPSIKYRKIQPNLNPSVETYIGYDGTQIGSLHVEIEKGSTARESLIYYGDHAKIDVKMNDEFLVEDHEAGEALESEYVHITEGQDSQTDKDHGEDFWKGFSVSIDMPVQAGVSQTLAIVLHDVKIDGDDVDQMSSYNGKAYLVFNSEDPFVQKNLEVDQSAEFYTQKLASLMNKGACSGIRSLRLSDLGEFTSVRGTIKNIYNGKVPADKVLDFKVVLNDDDIICERVNVDSQISYSAGDDGLYNIDYDVTIPITADDTKVFGANDVLHFYAIVYDLYGNASEVEVLRLNGFFRSDIVDESTRRSSGKIANDSEFGDLQGNFGHAFSSSLPVYDAANDENALIKIGRNTSDGKYVAEYRWPEGKFVNITYPGKFEGETIGDSKWACMCVEVAELDCASGFTIEIPASPGYEDKMKMDPLTGSTENMKIQCCVVAPSGKKQCSWLDCNTPNDGFSKPNAFLDAAMYAGKSTATVKRVTFGRQTYSGTLYVRIAISKDSGIRFQDIKLLEVI